MGRRRKMLLVGVVIDAQPEKEWEQTERRSACRTGGRALWVRRGVTRLRLMRGGHSSCCPRTFFRVWRHDPSQEKQGRAPRNGTRPCHQNAYLVAPPLDSGCVLFQSALALRASGGIAPVGGTILVGAPGARSEDGARHTRHKTRPTTTRAATMIDTNAAGLTLCFTILPPYGPTDRRPKRRSHGCRCLPRHDGRPASPRPKRSPFRCATWRARRQT